MTIPTKTNLRTFGLFALMSLLLHCNRQPPYPHEQSIRLHDCYWTFAIDPDIRPDISDDGIEWGEGENDRAMYVKSTSAVTLQYLSIDFGKKIFSPSGGTKVSGFRAASRIIIFRKSLRSFELDYANLETNHPRFELECHGEFKDVGYTRMVGWPVFSGFKRIHLHGFRGTMRVLRNRNGVKDLLAEIDFHDAFVNDIAHKFIQSPDGNYLIFRSTKDPRKPMVYVFRYDS